MISKERSDQIFGGVMLIGIAILFITNWFWPGILFVLGIALIVKTVNEGKDWTDNKGALIALAVGGFFVLEDALNLFSGNLFPLILITVGLYLLFGRNLRNDGEKSKNHLV